jgi:hypothetical protein
MYNAPTEQAEENISRECNAEQHGNYLWEKITTGLQPLVYKDTVVAGRKSHYSCHA